MSRMLWASHKRESAKVRKSKCKYGHMSSFTLLELVTVVVIIAILAAIAVPLFLNQKRLAYRAAIEEDVHNAQIAYQQARTESPNESDQLVVTACNELKSLRK